MDFVEKINSDLKSALRSRDKDKLSVLRMLLAALKNKKIELKLDRELDDGSAVEVLQSEIKKRKDAILSFKDGNREDLAEKESNELEILRQYMPEQMTEAEIREAVERAVSLLGAAAPGDFGKVMGKIMAENKGKADGVEVQKIVREILNK